MQKTLRVAGRPCRASHPRGRSPTFDKYTEKAAGFQPCPRRTCEGVHDRSCTPLRRTGRRDPDDCPGRQRKGTDRSGFRPSAGGFALWASSMEDVASTSERDSGSHLSCCWPNAANLLRTTTSGALSWSLPGGLTPACCNGDLRAGADRGTLMSCFRQEWFCCELVLR